MLTQDKPNEAKRLSIEDQNQFLRLGEEIKIRQDEMAMIVSRYLQKGLSAIRQGVPMQDGEGNTIGSYDALNGLCYPLVSSGGC